MSKINLIINNNKQMQFTDIEEKGKKSLYNNLIYFVDEYFIIYVTKLIKKFKFLF